MNVLLIANSFGVNLQTYAKQIAEANGLDLTIYTLYIGGCSLEQHNTNIEQNNKSYELFINGKNSNQYISIDEALALKKWDYISLQQASHLSGIIASYYPYLENVYTHIKGKCPNSEMMFHQTWAYSDKNTLRFNAAKESYGFFKFKTPFEMKKGIDFTLERIINDFKFNIVVRSGDIVFEAMKYFDDVYDLEGFHLNSLGCYLIGLNLIKLLTNNKLRELFVPKELDFNICRQAFDFINKN